MFIQFENFAINRKALSTAGTVENWKRQNE